MKKTFKKLSAIFLSTVLILNLSITAFAGKKVEVIPTGQMVGAGSGNVPGSGGGNSDGSGTGWDKFFGLSETSITGPIDKKKIEVKQLVSVNPRITLRFSKNVGSNQKFQDGSNLRDVNSSKIKLYIRDKYQRVQEVANYTIAFSDNFNERNFIQVRANKLKPNTTYQVVIEKGIRARNGQNTTADTTVINFRTEVTPNSGGISGPEMISGGSGGAGAGGGFFGSLIFGDPNEVKTTNKLSPETLKKATDEAIKISLETLRLIGTVPQETYVDLENIKPLEPTDFKLINDNVKQNQSLASTKVIVHMDSVLDNAITARMYINAETASKLKTNINPIVNVKKDFKDNKRSLEIFEKYFTNKMAVATFEQKGDFGMTVSVAAKIDIGTLDKTKLRFYSYNLEKNFYSEIQIADYFYDESGFLHFNTNVGNTLIITDSPLQSK